MHILKTQSNFSKNDVQPRVHNLFLGNWRSKLISQMHNNMFLILLRLTIWTSCQTYAGKTVALFFSLKAGFNVSELVKQIPGGRNDYSVVQKSRLLFPGDAE